MLFLAIFGKNVEDALGSLRYLVFYFAGGFVAMLTQTAMTLLFGTASDARVPELGASDAIAAVLGANFVLYPCSRVPTYHLSGLPDPDPGLDLPRAVVPLPALRGELRVVQRLGQRGRRGLLRPCGRIHLRPGRGAGPHQRRPRRTPDASRLVRAADPFVTGEAGQAAACWEPGGGARCSRSARVPGPVADPLLVIACLP
jgi:hypothetical protein